ncbi:thioredoxin domain-containing protein [Lactococcus petauri]|uniref:hypothetical protein n=1 Tax=Lactococcus petauri TaxID=1940789 RepID=UPI00177E016B|nr:hypothetical protein [Lactococcus petauri]MBD5824511.1 hypothetical protein [Lactococcus petauri]
MITLYYREHSKDSKRAIEWFRKNNLEINRVNINEISEKSIFQLIYLSDMEISQILRQGPLSYFLHYKKKKAKALRFSESLHYLEKNSNLLQDPIILSPNFSQIGYDEARLLEYSNKL